MGWNYSEKTKQIFMDAVQGKPGTHLGEIEDPDGYGEHGSIACGDALRFTFRCEKHPSDPLKDVIVECRYLTFGCTSAIAASEALCALIEEGGFTPISALQISNKDIVRYLDGLPEQKIHCSVMGAEALEAAVFNWATRRGVDLNELGIDMQHEEQEEGRIVCQCFGLSEPYIRRKIEELGLRTIPEITGAIKAGGACMTCHHVPGGLHDILKDVWGEEADPFRMLPPSQGQAPPKPEDALSPFKFAKKVEKVVEEYIRPLLRKDGGDLELLDIKDTLVFFEMQGACAGCTGADQTVKQVVEKTLKDRVDIRIRVVVA